MNDIRKKIKVIVDGKDVDGCLKEADLIIFRSPNGTEVTIGDDNYSFMFELKEFLRKV